MHSIADSPVLVFGISFCGLWLLARIGAALRTSLKDSEQSRIDNARMILSAVLTLLSLIIGFSYSMAVSRYDQRKNYEELEANTIGAEYLRAGLLPPDGAARVQALLRSYLEQRILAYSVRDEQTIRQVRLRTSRLQDELWQMVQAASAKPSPNTSLVAYGMNAVLDAQGYARAAARNRIPRAAWMLLITIAGCCALLVGYCMEKPQTRSILFLTLPFIISASFFLIADIDTPNGGIIRVAPQNLSNLSDSLRAR